MYLKFDFKFIFINKNVRIALKKYIFLNIVSFVDSCFKAKWWFAYICGGGEGRYALYYIHDIHRKLKISKCCIFTFQLISLENFIIFKMNFPNLFSRYFFLRMKIRENILNYASLKLKSKI